MSDDQRIVVRGEAERQAPADIAGLTVVVQVDDTAEPGLRHPGGFAMGTTGGSLMPMRGDMAVDAELPVGPAELSVVASVEVGFALER